MGTTTKKRPAPAAKRPVDWSLTPRGTASMTAQVALGLAAGGVAGDVADVGAIWAAGGATVGALGAVVAGTRHNLSQAALGYRLGCWAAAGGWLTWAWAVTPWSQASAGALVLGALGAGVLAPLGRKAPADPVAAELTAAGGGVVHRGGGDVGRAWEARLERVCRVRGAIVTDVDRWGSGAGYDVHVDLPLGGTTVKVLAMSADRLAADARLPIGCGVEVAEGRHRGAVVLRVSTVNRLHQNIGCPDDYSPRSILDPVELGEYRDSSIAGVPLRELSAIVAGQRGSGKTTTLHVVTLGVGRCRDALNWHIDLNGGGLSQPWLAPWLDGETDRPAIDWAAADIDEAILMVGIALAIARSRKTDYRRLKIEQDTSLLPVSADLPEIIITVDEGAEAVSPGKNDPQTRALREDLQELQRIGRNEAVNPIFSALRATADTIPASVKKQAGARIGMRAQDEEELSYLYGWNRGISVEDLPTQGCGFLAYESTPPRPFKAYNLLPRQIGRAAVAIARMRPELDALGRKTAGDLYESRYERMRAAFGDEGGQTEIDTLAPASAPARPRGDAHVIPLRPSGSATARRSPAPVSAAQWGDPRDVAGRAPRRPAAGPAASWPDPPPTRVRVEQVGPARPTTAPPAAEVPALLERLAAVFDRYPHEPALHTGLILAELGGPELTPKRLSQMLGGCGVTSQAEAFHLADRTISDKKLRGYQRADVAAAIGRIRAGEMTPPREVYAWRTA